MSAAVAPSFVLVGLYYYDYETKWLQPRAAITVFRFVRNVEIVR